MTEVSEEEIPIEVSIDWITERLHDLDFRPLDIWNVEFLHRGAQAHFYPFKLQVDCNDSLVPDERIHLAFETHKHRIKLLTPKTESGMPKARASLFYSDGLCIELPKSLIQVLWISFPRRP